MSLTHAPGAGLYSGALRRRLEPGPALDHRIETILLRIDVKERELATMRNHAQALMLRRWAGRPKA